MLLADMWSKSMTGLFFFLNLGNVAVCESVTQMEDTGEGTIYILNIKEQFEMWRLFV